MAEIIFWHIPSTAYKKVAPVFGIHKPCVGSINRDRVAPQEIETGIMKLLVERPSVKVSRKLLISLFVLLATANSTSQLSMFWIG